MLCALNRTHGTPRRCPPQFSDQLDRLRCVVAAVERAVSRAATADDVLAGLAAEVSKAVFYDGAMWFGVDPTTLLAVAPSRMEHLDDGYGRGTASSTSTTPTSSATSPVNRYPLRRCVRR